jgi:hypothetical protein
VLPDVEMPAMFPVISPAPELSANEPVLPSIILVPTFNILPLFTVKLMALEIVPPDFRYVWVPVLEKLKLPVPLPPVVKVPLVIEKSPDKLIVPVFDACLKISKVPEAKERFPLTFKMQLPEVLPPNGAKYPPVIERFPKIDAVNVDEFVNNNIDNGLGEAPVDCIVKFPLILVSPPKENADD